MRKADRTKQGVVFNIQKFSVNDGPGIRTVVFFKGCPLRCKWCANPESQLVKTQIMWDRKKCLNCHHCMAVCPEQAIVLKDGHIHVDARLCTGCKECLPECPARALTAEGELKTVEECIRVVMQDLPFYEESGGGITLSGGEFLSQPDFAEELLMAAKEEGLHTCCETTAFTSPEIFKRLIALMDYAFIDMKHWDSAKHKEGTGVGNELILANMALAHSMGVDVLPRIPVIPGFNDSLEDAAGFAKALQKVGILKCQLLPFHQFGENKYHLLDQEYTYEATPALHKEDLEEYMQVFIDNGVGAFIK